MTKGVGKVSRVTHASGSTLITYTVRADQSRKKMGKKSTSAEEKTMPETKKERLLTLRNVPGLLIRATGKQMGLAFIYRHSQPIRTFRD